MAMHSQMLVKTHEFLFILFFKPKNDNKETGHSRTTREWLQKIWKDKKTQFKLRKEWCQSYDPP